MIRSFLRFAVLTAVVSSLGSACSSSDKAGSAGPVTPLADSGRGLERTGQACTAASQCFPDVKEGSAVIGEPICLDRVQDGYCTHLCTADTDCCAVAGECVTSLRQVCAPFESTGQNMCFLSCEEADIRAHETNLSAFTTDGGGIDANLFCATRAGTDFLCRSTGGGARNRKVCVPGGTSTTQTDGGGGGGGGRPGRP